MNLIRVMPAKGQDIFSMSTSLFLAKLIGPLFLAVRAGLLASAAVYKQLTDEFLTPRALIYFR